MYTSESEHTYTYTHPQIKHPNLLNKCIKTKSLQLNKKKVCVCNENKTENYKEKVASKMRYTKNIHIIHSM